MNNATIDHGTQVRILIKEKIIEYMCKHGYAPSFAEIGEMVGLKSKSSVHAHIKHMLRIGILETDHEEGFARALRVPGYVFVKKE